MADTERIDKVLWAIRVFKTRTEATDACKGGKVKIGGVNAKPSRMLKVGEVVEIRKGSVQYSYRIKQLTDHRLGAKLVPDYAENLTPQSELDKLKAPVKMECYLSGLHALLFTDWDILFNYVDYCEIIQQTFREHQSRY